MIFIYFIMKSIVKIQTWGTSVCSGYGIMTFLKNDYRCENYGHVSIEIQLACGEENDALIKRYCEGTPTIPHVTKLILNSNGVKEKVHLVRFSFLPSKGAFVLNETYKSDTLYERAGHNSTERDYLELSELDERKAKTRNIHIFPACSLTSKGRALDFTRPEGKYVLKQKEIAQCEDLQETLSILTKKTKSFCESKNKGIMSYENTTLRLAAKRLRIQLPEQANINTEELKKLIDADRINQELQERLTCLIAERDALFATNKECLSLVQENIDDYLCYGRPADSEVLLPIGDDKYELSAAAMLQQMRLIANSGFKYDIDTHNCSNTAMSILKSGEVRRASEVKPAIITTVITPQMIHNYALLLRNKVCKVSACDSIKKLDAFFENIPIDTGMRVIPRESKSLNEALLGFAIDNIFPDSNDRSFYVFSKQAKKNLIKYNHDIIPTDLLRDLWGIIPGRTLPLSDDGLNDVVVDKNMTFGELVQGLTIIAKRNAEDRLNLPKHICEEVNKEKFKKSPPLEKDPYIILTDKIKSEIDRIQIRRDKKSQTKTINLMNAFINITQELNSETPQKTNHEKSEILYKELIPYLKVNTGFNFREATTFTEVRKLVIELGLTGNTPLMTKFKEHQTQESKAPTAPEKKFKLIP